LIDAIKIFSAGADVIFKSAAARETANRPIHTPQQGTLWLHPEATP
jgi:hypothetical protein